MTFTVQPGALRELSGLLDRARQDIDGAAAHLAKTESLQSSEGLLGGCLDGHRAAYRTLSDWLGTAADPILRGTAAAVAASATYYERTDATSAAALDATYPEPGVADRRDETIESVGTGRFADVADPSKHLTGPGDYTAELEGGELMWWDWVSPSALLGQAIEAVSEVAVWLGLLDHSFNPQEEIAKQFVGDWAGARAAADILRDVGRSVTDTALNVQWAAQGIDQVWQGNAAHGATGYLVNLARRLDIEHAWPPIDTLAQQYQDASADMVRLRDAAVGVLNSISDAAAEAAVACGVAGGAASTGVGTPVAALAALFAGSRIMRVVSGVRELRDVVGGLAAATSALKAAQDGFAGPGGLSLPTLPAAPIDTPR